MRGQGKFLLLIKFVANMLGVYRQVEKYLKINILLLAGQFHCEPMNHLRTVLTGKRGKYAISKHIWWQYLRNNHWGKLIKNSKNNCLDYFIMCAFTFIINIFIHSQKVIQIVRKSEIVGDFFVESQDDNLHFSGKTRRCWSGYAIK